MPCEATGSGGSGGAATATPRPSIRAAAGEGEGILGQNASTGRTSDRDDDGGLAANTASDLVSEGRDPRVWIGEVFVDADGVEGCKVGQVVLQRVILRCVSVGPVVDRDALKVLVRVEDDSWPSLLCQTCGAGHLRFAEVTQNESARSVRARDHDSWDPDWISGTFTVTATCNNPRCAQAILFAGDYGVGYGGDQGEHYVDHHDLRYANPALPIMDFAPGTPEEVVEGVARASALLYLDASAAANALRAAVERFLTVEGIPRTDGKGFLRAHARIGRWKDKTGNDDAANCFWAVKWVGNDGSHEMPTLTVAQVLDGAEILEYAFRLLFDKTGDRIAAAAAAINAAKGLSR